MKNGEVKGTATLARPDGGGQYLGTQGRFRAARGAYYLAALALALGTLGITTNADAIPQWWERGAGIVIALTMIGFLLFHFLRAIDEKENPVVAELTVGPIVPAGSQYAIIVRVRCGAEPIGFRGGWKVSVDAKVRPRQLGRLGVPALRLGAKTVRYLRSDVLAWLEGQRSAHRLTSRPTPGNGE